MRRSAIPAVLVAGLLALSSCSSLQSDDDASGPPTVTVTTTKPGKAPKPTGGKGSEGKSSKGSSEGDEDSNAEPGGRGVTDVPASTFDNGDKGVRMFLVKSLGTVCVDNSRKERGAEGYQLLCSNMQERLPGLYSEPASGLEPQPQNEFGLATGPTGPAWTSRASLTSPGGGSMQPPKELKPGQRVTLGEVTCTAGRKDLECESKTGPDFRSTKPHRIRVTDKEIYVDDSEVPLGGTCAPVKAKDGKKLVARLTRGDNDCKTMRATLQEYADGGYSNHGPGEVSTGYRCMLGATAEGQKGDGSCTEKNRGQYSSFTIEFV